MKFDRFQPPEPELSRRDPFEDDDYRAEQELREDERHDCAILEKLKRQGITTIPQAGWTEFGFRLPPSWHEWLGTVEKVQSRFSTEWKIKTP